MGVDGMKPIEPGCLVVVLNAEHKEYIGLSGVVIGQGVARGFIRGDKSITEPDPSWWSVRIDGSLFGLCRPAHDLLRIDDYDASTEETEKEKELTQ